MTLRANEIGADVYSTQETELDKNNLDIEKEETEHRFEFPELAPGRALLDVETGVLYEIMHRTSGFTDTVEGRQSEKEERMNWKYRTPEGQDWGGIIQHYHISYAKRQCPTPNQHGEIQAPINRPSEKEITDVKPGLFEENVLLDGDLPRPFLLLERPEVTYEEVMAGDTYDILGWYDPMEANIDSRIKPAQDIASQHPEIVGVDSTTHIAQELTELGIRVPWSEADDTQPANVHIDPLGDKDENTAYEISMHDSPSDFHITLGHAFGDRRFLIESPYDAKEDIKQLSSNPRWDSDNTVWTVTAGEDSLHELIKALTAAGWTISFDARVIAEYATTDVTVEPAEEVTVTTPELFDYAFTEEIEISEGVSIPGLDASVDLDSVESSIAALTSEDGTVTVTGVDQIGDNHIEALTDGTVRFDCPKGNASLIKSLDWKEARYEWSNEHAQWEINASAAGALIETFLDSNKDVTIPVSILTDLGEEDSITEERQIEVDDEAVTGLDSYSTNSESASNDVTDDVTVTCDQIHGTSPTDPDRLSLMALEMSLADTGSNDGMSVALASGDLDELPHSVVDQWMPDNGDTEETKYDWYHPMTSARVIVEETEGWGTEFAIKVKEPYMDEAEHVVTLADERMVVLTVINHLKAMTDSNN